MQEFDPGSSVPKVLIVAAGSDYRAYEILRKINTRRIIIDHLIMVHFVERIEFVESKGLKEQYYSYQSIQCTNLTELKASYSNPSDFFQSLSKIDDITSVDRRVGLDITCFTKPFFFGLLKLFFRIDSLTSPNVFYTEPGSYIFERGLYNAFSASSGPTKIIEPPGFVGQNERESTALLVIQLGFESDLAHEINEDVAPSEVILINGFPSLSPKFKDLSLVNNERLVSSGRNKVRYCRANNPFDFYNLLEEIVKEAKKNYYINVAPLGTKPMALGACMFALHNPKVRIVYPMPETYANETSQNCKKSWEYRIPLVLPEATP
jgi:hypothetical protein